jgi:hypothetical protein
LTPGICFPRLDGKGRLTAPPKIVAGQIANLRARGRGRATLLRPPIKGEHWRYRGTESRIGAPKAHRGAAFRLVRAYAMGYSLARGTR